MIFNKAELHDSLPLDFMVGNLGTGKSLEIKEIFFAIMKDINLINVNDNTLQFDANHEKRF